MIIDQRIFSSLDQSESGTFNYVEPDRFRSLDKIVDSDQTIIARGSGLSYIAASFGESSTSVGMKFFNKILAFDGQTITVQAGASVWEVQKFLLSHGKTLPVQPGYPRISIGGCIACNVHGKNQYVEGLFCDWVTELWIQSPEGAQINTKKGEFMFDCTSGGFGLTGVIICASIHVHGLKGTSIIEEHIPTANLVETVDILFENSEKKDLLYSWNNLTKPGLNYGAGFVIAGSYSKEIPPIHNEKCYPLIGEPNKYKWPLINSLSIPFINMMYQRINARKKNLHRSIYEYSYPAASQGFYFDLFGRQGFFEIQALIPRSNWALYASRLERLQQSYGQKIALASIKLFKGPRKKLHFSGDGISIAIDLSRSKNSLAFAKKLDEINSEMGAISCIHKDSRLDLQTVRDQYGKGYDEFKDQLKSLNLKGKYKSQLATRLDLI